MKKLFVLAAAVCLLATASFAQRVRVVHASPDAPAVDIYVDGQIALTGIPFGEYTDYVDLPGGQRTFSVFVAGTNTRVADVSPFLTPGLDYTVVAMGFAGGGKTPAFRLMLLVDANAEPLEGFAKVRVIHAAPSAPAVDIYWTKPFVALRGQLPVLTSVPFGAASNYLTVPTGKAAQYQARVAVGGTQTVAINSGRLVLNSQEVRTIIAVDNAGGGAPFSAIVLRDRN
jgi:hypothetical protein